MPCGRGIGRWWRESGENGGAMTEGLVGWKFLIEISNIANLRTLTKPSVIIGIIVALLLLSLLSRVLRGRRNVKKRRSWLYVTVVFLLSVGAMTVLTNICVVLLMESSGLRLPLEGVPLIVGFADVLGAGLGAWLAVVRIRRFAKFENPAASLAVAEKVILVVAVLATLWLSGNARRSHAGIVEIAFVVQVCRFLAFLAVARSGFTTVSSTLTAMNYRPSPRSSPPVEAPSNSARSQHVSPNDGMEQRRRAEGREHPRGAHPDVILDAALAAGLISKDVARKCKAHREMLLQYGKSATYRDILLEQGHVTERQLAALEQRINIAPSAQSTIVQSPAPNEYIALSAKLDSLKVTLYVPGKEGDHADKATAEKLHALMLDLKVGPDDVVDTSVREYGRRFNNPGSVRWGTPEDVLSAFMKCALRDGVTEIAYHDFPLKNGHGATYAELLVSTSTSAHAHLVFRRHRNPCYGYCAHQGGM